MNTPNQKATRFSITLASLLVVPTALSLAYNVSIDPFQLYSPDPPGEVTYLGDQGRDRYQPAGIVHNHNPKSIVLGSSWAANFYPTQLEQVLEWENAFSFTLDGGSLHEQSTIARFALRHADLTNVLWLLSPQNFDTEVNSTHRKLPFPDYLYNNIRADDLRLYTTSPTNLRKYTDMKIRKLEQLKQERQLKNQPVDARDRATEWGTVKWRRFHRPLEVMQMLLGEDYTGRAELESVVPSEWLSEKEVAALQPSSLREKRISAHFEQNVFPVVKDNPRVQFHFIIHPPFSFMYWQAMKTQSTQMYYDYMYITRVFVDELSKLANVHIFAFGDLPSNVDLRLYKDERHFHGVVNNYMIQLMNGDGHSLTASNVTAYLSNFDKVVTQYDADINNWIDYAKRTSNQVGLSEKEALTILQSHDPSMNPAERRVSK